jgi:hypothetical protein
LGEIQVSHQRRVGREGGIPVAPCIVEELPGQHRELGGLYTQLEAQSLALPPRLAEAHLVTGAHVAYQKRLEESLAEVLHRVLLG